MKGGMEIDGGWDKQEVTSETGVEKGAMEMEYARWREAELDGGSLGDWGWGGGG